MLFFALYSPPSLWLARNIFNHRSVPEPEDVNGGGGGKDKSVGCGAGSQWIVAARPLYHLQYPVVYLIRLQRIQPAAREEGSQRTTERDNEQYSSHLQPNSVE